MSFYNIDSWSFLPKTHFWTFSALILISYIILGAIYSNKKCKKLKTKLFKLLLSQKHYVIFSNNVWRVNITWKHYRLRDSKLAECLDCKRFGFTFFA